MLFFLTFSPFHFSFPFLFLFFVVVVVAAAVPVAGGGEEAASQVHSTYPPPFHGGVRVGWVDLRAASHTHTRTHARTHSHTHTRTQSPT